MEPPTDEEMTQKLRVTTIKLTPEEIQALPEVIQVLADIIYGIDEQAETDNRSSR